MKLLLLFIYPVFLCLICALIFKQTSLLHTIKKNRKRILLFALFTFAVLNLFVLVRMRLEDFIPYRDYAGFYRYTLILNQAFDHSSALEYFSMIYDTMLYDEYSYFGEMFLVLPMKIIGNSYSRYVLSMVNSFIVPVNVFLYCAFLHTKWIELSNKWIDFCVMIFITLFAMNIMPTVYGYIGSAAFFFIVSVLFLSYHELKKEEVSIFTNLSIGILLVMIVLVRRWYAYVVVAYFMILGLAYLVKFVKTRDFKTFKIVYIKLFLQGIAALLIMLIFFLPMVKSYTMNDYTVLYAAAMKRSWIEQIKSFINNYSPVVFVLSCCAFLNRKNIIEKVILALMTIVTFVLFSNVQDFGAHHYYMTNIMILLLSVSGIEALLSHIKMPVLLSVLISVIVTVNFISMGLIELKFPGYQYLISTRNFQIRTTPEREKIEMLSHYLANVPEDYEYCYILSDTIYLNDDLIRNALLPNVINATPWLEGTKVWDQRDGLPAKFFQYVHLVVTDPIQMSSNPEEQKVIGILADGILHDEELRKYYRLEWEFDYADMKVHVYRRIEDIPNELIQKYSDYFKAEYPDQPHLYEFEMNY